MIRRPPRSTQSRSSAASDVYKRQLLDHLGDVLEVDIVALEGDLDVLDLVVDLDERDVDAVDALEVAELVGEHEHRGLVRFEHVEHETPDLAHVVITLRSRVAGEGYKRSIPTRRRRRRQIPAPWSKARRSASISWVWRTASWRLPLRSGWISSSSCSISTMRATRHLTASATGSGR